GANNSYKMVFTFSNPLNSCGVASSGSVTAGPNSNQCSVDVSVSTGNYVTVQLTGVADANSNIGNFSSTMGVLIGDVNATGGLEGNAVSAVQSATRHAVSRLTLRDGGNV